MTTSSQPIGLVPEAVIQMQAAGMFAALDRVEAAQKFALAAAAHWFGALVVAPAVFVPQTLGHFLSR